jgi:dUTP pyrophosphatase
MTIDVKFKKLHEDAVLPSYAKTGDAGLDITATSDGVATFSKDKEDRWYYIEYKTGIAVEIPYGYVGLLFPRSSICKSSLFNSNAVGVIDSGYRGELCFRFKLDAGIVQEATACNQEVAKYKKGDRIGQLIIVPYPTVLPQFVDDLSESERGTNGFGSTNVKEVV